MMLALLGWGCAHADEGSAQARFAEARAAFDAQDYATALALYEQALALGLDGPAVHYNIGVAAFKSGNLERAELAFTAAARTPAMASLAHYNLGLVALRRGDTRAARRGFARAAEDLTDPRVAALARERLGELPGQAAPPAWSLYARAGGGYDDNVALRSESIDGAASGDSDAFTELQFGASATFARAWSVDAGAATVNHRDLDEFDQSAFSLGARRGFDRDGWRTDVGAYVARLTLDGEAFEQSAALVLNAAGTLGGVHMLRGHYRLVSVDGRGAYEGLSGTRNHFRFEYQRPRARWTFGARASAEFNDTEDALFESRWSELGASASWAQSPRWAYAVDVAARRTDHSADPGVREAWDERRLTFGVSVYRALLERLQIVLRYEHERNSASLADYDYDRNRASASIEYWQ